MTRTVEIRFSLTPLECLNANQRLHWADKSRRTRTIRRLAQMMANKQAGTTAIDRARLVVSVGWPDKRRRDVANLSPTIKAAIDGIVDAGLLPDDSDAHLVGPDLRPYVAGEKGRVLLTFTFTELAEGEAV